MANLPSGILLGPLPVADSRRQTADADVTGYAKGAAAMAEGVKDLGKGIASFGKDVARAEMAADARADELESARLTSEFNVRSIEKQAELTAGVVGGAAPTGPDPADLPTTVGNSLKAERDSLIAGANFKDPRRAQMFVYKTNDDITRAQIRADALARQVIADKQLADEDKLEERTIIAIVNEPNEQERARMIKDYRDRISTLPGLKLESAQDNYKRDTAFRMKYATAFANATADKGGADAVLAELEQAKLNRASGDKPAKPTMFDALPELVFQKLNHDILLKRDGQLIDEQRRAALERRRAQAASDAAETEHLKNLYGGTGVETSAKVIVNDDRLNREAKERMIGIAERAAKPDPIAAVSQHTTMRLMDSLRRADGDPFKMTDTTPIYDEYIAGNLTRGDFEFLRKEFKELRTPEGQSLGERKKEFLSSVKPLIDPSNPLMGVLSKRGPQKFYSFTFEMERKIEEYRKTGKDPHDLFNPGKPDYLGKKELLEPYQTTMQDALKEMAEDMAPAKRDVARGAKAATPAAPAPVPMPVTPKRNVPLPGAPVPLPGETPDQYLRRNDLFGGGAATAAPVTEWPSVPRSH